MCVSVYLLYAFNVIYNFWTPRCVFKFSSSDVSSYITQCSAYCPLPHTPHTRTPPLTLLCCRHTCSTAISLSISNAIYEKRQQKKKKGEETQHKRKTSKSCWQSLNNISLLDPLSTWPASDPLTPDPWSYPPNPFLFFSFSSFFVLVLRMCLEINKYVDGLRVCLCVCLFG